MTEMNIILDELENIFDTLDKLIIQIGDKIDDPKIYEKIRQEILIKHPSAPLNRAKNLEKLLKYINEMENTERAELEIKKKRSMKEIK